MPLSSLLSMVDNIAGVLDDVATLTKVAAKKTTGVLGDDLALNAQQVSGVSADRELPVVFAVAKGSAINKAILVPAALAISALVPWLVAPLLMVGGAYLCFEGVEKLAEPLLHGKHGKHENASEPAPPKVAPPDAGDVEKTKIRGAIRTDFVLSAEIVVITLGSVAEAKLTTQVFVLVVVAVLMTVGVYGFVAAIVKLDDAGLSLSRRRGDGAWARALRGVGIGILQAAPYLMRSLSVVGTVAMFLVGGGILMHGFHRGSEWTEALAHRASGLPVAGGLLGWLIPLIADVAVGLVTGAVVLVVVMAGKAVASRLRARPSSGK
jgi:predicted DNA repair protein MutK